MNSVFSRLPTLSEHRWLRFSLFTLYYFIQGLPLGFAFIALPAWLIAEGVDPARVSMLIGIAGLPWVFKLVAGPVMDRYSFPAMGVRRPWVLGTQFMIFLTACCLVFLKDVEAHFILLTIIATILNAFAAFQDVAVDGMAIQLLREDEQGRANAFMGAGQVLGMSLIGSMAVKALNFGGMPAAGIMMASILIIIILISLLFRERPGERILPWTSGDAHPGADLPEGSILIIFKNLIISTFLPMSFMSIVVVFISTTINGIGSVWFPDIAISVCGYSDTTWADWLSITGIVSAFIGLLFGILIDRIGVKTTLAIAFAYNAVVYLLLFTLFDRFTSPGIGIFAVFAAQFGVQFSFICGIALFMQISNKRIAATQFAVYMAVLNLGRVLGSFIYPGVKESFGIKETFLVVATGFLISLLILSRINLATHQKQLQMVLENDDITAKKSPEYTI